MSSSISPELVLVDPDLRALALALLPAYELTDFAVPRRLGPAAAATPAAAQPARSLLLRRAALYLAVQLAMMAVWGAFLVAGVVACVSLLS